jgi:hypothetical protein
MTISATSDQPGVDALASAARPIDLESSGKKPCQRQRLEFTDEQKRCLLQHKIDAKAANKRVSWMKLSNSELFKGFTKLRLKNTTEGLWRAYNEQQSRAAKREAKQVSAMRGAVAKAEEAERKVVAMTQMYKEVEDENTTIRMRQFEDNQRHKEEVDKLHHILKNTEEDWAKNKEELCS